MIAQLDTPQEAANWLRTRVMGELRTDSRSIQPGDGFVAWPGAAHDARRYIDGALKADASACLVEKQGIESYGFTDKKIAAYPDLKAAAALIAAAYYGEPSQHLQAIAITGTNGKTSTAWWLAHALGKLNLKCGVVGTLGIGAPDALVPNGLTTPDPVLLQQRLRRFVDEGFAACAIEASSIGIAEQRLDATHFQVAVFTNFTQDHLDYHGSMQAYWAAKESLFSWPGLVSAVINLDDAHGQVLAERLKASSLDIWTVSINQSARLQAQRIEQAANTVTFDVIEGADCAVVSTGALGSYNVSNLLGVIGAMRALGVSLGDAAAACCDLPAVPGRLNTFAAPGAPLAVIDYAHTPDAIEKVLLALRPVAQSRGGQLWCVFGCAGDRDAAKRPLMATMAEKYSDCVVVTSDNPRTEDPQSIISQVLPGFQKPGAVHVQADRALAIAQTLARAKPADVVLLAGKGHEDYQEIHGVKYSFEDQLHAQAALSARSSAGAAA